MKLARILIACTIAQALPSIRPGASWNMRGDQYDGLEWLEKAQAKPSQAEVTQAVTDCNARESTVKTERDQAVVDAKDSGKTDTQRLNALIKAIDLK